MSLGKQAKTLSKGQIEAVLGYLAKTRHPARNRLIFLLSVPGLFSSKTIAMAGNSGRDGHAIGWVDGLRLEVAKPTPAKAMVAGTSPAIVVIHSEVSHRSGRYWLRCTRLPPMNRPQQHKRVPARNAGTPRDPASDPSSNA